MHTPVLETPRLLLRPWREEDARDLYAIASDPLVGPAAGWEPHKDTEESRAIIRTVLSAPETYAIIWKETGLPVGSASLMPPRARQKEAVSAMELGYWVARSHWGQGIMPEAAGLLIRRAFIDLGCAKLWCGYFEGNERSARVQEKCGFTYDHEELVHWETTGQTLREHFTVLSREDWERGLICRRLSAHEMPAALDLAWEVFSVFVSPGYTPQGAETFRAFVSAPGTADQLEAYGAFLDGRLIGTICLAPGGHISLFFVRSEHQREGIGKRLLETVLGKYGGVTLTVNASPMSAGAYERMGFTPAGKEQLRDGIRFVPMERRPKLRIHPFETERLRIRPVAVEDEGDMLKYLSDARVMAFEPSLPMTAEDLRREMEDSSPVLWLALEEKESGVVLGHITLEERDFDTLELGYILNREYWRRHYAYEACSALLPRLFSQHWHRIEADCDPRNPASWKLLEKLGFTREALLKDHLYFHRDKDHRPIWKDTLIYSYLNPERP